MKSIRILLLSRLLGILLATIAFACQEKIDPFPIIRTGVVTNISEKGATFHGKITQFGNEEIKDYGFVWSEEAYPTIDGKAKFFGQPPTAGEFEYVNSAGLTKDTTYFVRSFMQTANSVIYGDMVSFQSLGGQTPVITGFEPQEGTYGTEITIKGNYFSDALSENNIRIEHVNCEIIKSGRTELIVRVGDGIIVTGKYKLFTQVGSQSSYSSNEFNFEGFQIDSISPKKGLPNSNVQLWCRNAPENFFNISIVTNEVSYEIPGAHYTYSPTEIRFKIPYNVAYIGSAQIQIELFDGKNHRVDTLLTDYELTGPQIISFSPEEVFPGQKVDVLG